MKEKIKRWRINSGNLTLIELLNTTEKWGGKRKRSNYQRNNIRKLPRATDRPVFRLQDHPVVTVLPLSHQSTPFPFLAILELGVERLSPLPADTGQEEGASHQVCSCRLAPAAPRSQQHAECPRTCTPMSLSLSTLWMDSKESGRHPAGGFPLRYNSNMLVRIPLWELVGRHPTSLVDTLVGTS